MILDTTLEFADNLDVKAAGAGTVVLAKAVDLQEVVSYLGVGQPTMYLVVQVTKAFTTSASATVDIQLVSDSTDPATGGVMLHWSTGDLAAAALTLDRQFIVPLPAGTAYAQYLQMQVVTKVGATTAGSINAFLTVEPGQYLAYPEAAS